MLEKKSPKIGMQAWAMLDCNSPAAATEAADLAEFGENKSPAQNSKTSCNRTCPDIGPPVLNNLRVSLRALSFSQQWPRCT